MKGTINTSLKSSVDMNDVSEKYGQLTIEIPQQQSKPRSHRRRRRPRPVEERFHDLYEMTGEMLGEGAHGTVQGYKHKNTGKEFAVKVINKSIDYNRSKILKEIELFHHCRGHKNIVQLKEYYEEDDKFYLVFDKLRGGSLFTQIVKRGHLTELEASKIIKNLADAINFLHMKGIAHRDLKPENILCESELDITNVAICDFDLGNAIRVNEESPITTPELLTPVGSLEYMAPEVVDAWNDYGSYNKKCDIWSLGVILYTMLCGYPPFRGGCGRDCGFDSGESCRQCQDILFDKIQEGKIEFPEDWFNISYKAKDLIRKMLTVQPDERLTAQGVLDHDWIIDPAPKTLLATPHILSRNNSMLQFNEHLQKTVTLSRNLSCLVDVPPVFTVNTSDGMSDELSSSVDSNLSDLSSPVMFSMDDICSPQPQIHKIQLSSPSSALAKRRRSKSKSTAQLFL